MKTIVVPTDFSKAADHALAYALELARQLQAQLLLANAILLPVPVVTPAGIDIPYEGTSEILDKAFDELQAIKDDISTVHMGETKLPYPQISIAAGFGPPFVYLTKLVNQHGADLVVCGLSGAGGVHRFFLGSTSRDLINVAAFPLLLVPQVAPVKPIKQIVFASDLSSADIEIIRFLSPLAGKLGAEIRIAHICVENSAILSNKVSAFVKKATEASKGVKISYQSVYNRSEEEGFQWLLNHIQVDWFVMVHRQHGFLDSIFKETYCQKMAKQSTVPILIIPEHFHVKY